MKNIYLYIIAGIIIIGIGKHFYDKHELRIVQKQFSEERETWVKERDELIQLRYTAIDSVVAAQKPIYIRIKDLDKKNNLLKEEQKQIKLKRDEIQKFINNASESVLDSLLRSN